MILFNFDCLARPHEELGARVPDPEGMYLWRSLFEASVGRLGVLYTGPETETSEETLKAWLKINQVKAIMYETTGTREPKVVAEVAARILNASGGRSMYFDIDPHTVRETFAVGIPAFLMCSPFVIRPEWSTTKHMKGWDVLTEEIDRQALARAEKKWGDIE